jgi:hypothetical protein
MEHGSISGHESSAPSLGAPCKATLAPVRIEVGERVSFSALSVTEPPAIASAASSMRPGEFWEGVVDRIACDPETGRRKVTVCVDHLNGMRVDVVKEVYADSASWESP